MIGGSKLVRVQDFPRGRCPHREITRPDNSYEKSIYTRGHRKHVKRYRSQMHSNLGGRTRRGKCLRYTYPSQLCGQLQQNISASSTKEQLCGIRRGNKNKNRVILCEQRQISLEYWFKVILMVQSHFYVVP